MPADLASDLPPLQTPVQFIAGVGPGRAALLARLELRTVEDLLFNLPRDVLDLTKVTRTKDLKAETLQTVKGKVVDRDARLTKTGKTMTGILLDCGDGYVRGRGC
jgi:ATP-dependent DNA helicase RecG